MALHSILNDPHIAQFLEQIPQKEHIITLKELIYIGIKIVSNSFQQPQQNHKYQNKQNMPHNLPKQPIQKYHPYHQQNRSTKSRGVRRNTGSEKNVQQKIESALLREISKIRLQLESLTNKVYDHCFDHKQDVESDQVCEDSFDQAQNYYPTEEMPTFSPNRNKSGPLNNNNPFLKQKNNFFVTQPQAQPPLPQKPRQKSLQNRQPNQFTQRNRAKSHIMHLDDTQVRQALYKENDQIQQQNRFGKSRSLIEKKHEEKKKAQQNYFYELAVDKRRVKELQQIKQKKGHSSQQYQIPQRDYAYPTQQAQKKTVKNPYRKKVKSKIKKLVQRDRLRYQQKKNQYNFQKGFEQYQYSANEFSDQDENESQEQKNTVPYQEPYIVPNDEPKVKSHYVSKQSEEPARDRVSSQKKSSHQKPPLNPNFGFYSASQQDNSNHMEQSSFSHQKKVAQIPRMDEDEDENINVCSNSSSFSEFSMSGSSRASRRQAGKISRRRQD